MTPPCRLLAACCHGPVTQGAMHTGVSVRLSRIRGRRQCHAALQLPGRAALLTSHQCTHPLRARTPQPMPPLALRPPHPPPSRFVCAAHPRCLSRALNPALQRVFVHIQAQRASKTAAQKSKGLLQPWGGGGGGQVNLTCDCTAGGRRHGGGMPGLRLCPCAPVAAVTLIAARATGLSTCWATASLRGLSATARTVRRLLLLLPQLRVLVVGRRPGCWACCGGGGGRIGMHACDGGGGRALLREQGLAPLNMTS